ncbi:MAG: ABC transporter transmembrane domain-containing protein, partial [Chloroflexota bacterium]
MGGRGDQPGKRPSLAVYRRLLRFVAPYRWSLVLSAALLAVSTLLGLVWPQVVQRVLDVGLGDPGFLDLLIAGLVIVLLVRAVIDGVRQYVMSYTGERVIFDLRMAIVRHMQSLSLSFFNARRTGELMSHITSDATLVHGVVTQTIIGVLGQVLTLVGGVTIIFLMNWKLALLTLIVAPPIGLLGQRLGRMIRDLSRATQDAQADAVGVLQEAIAEMRVVQAFTREEYEAERFHGKLQFMFRKTMERARITSIMFPLIGFLGFASSIVVLWFGGHQVASGELTTGQLVAFLLYLGMVAGPIGGLAGQWGQIQSAFGAADRIFALLDTLPEVRDAPDAIALPAVRGEISFADVRFRYGDGPVVLDGVTTLFRHAETTALVGPSGAGKTTLVNLVGRF